MTKNKPCKQCGEPQDRDWAMGLNCSRCEPDERTFSVPLTAIEKIELKAGTYKINGETTEVHHDFIVHTAPNPAPQGDNHATKDLLDYYDVIWGQASGVDVERDRKIRGAIRAAEQRPEWQPIKTAPKDWSDILLFVPDSEENNDVMQGYYSCWDGGEDCWMSFRNEKVQPTHWMPLPEAPNGVKIADGGAE